MDIPFPKARYKFAHKRIFPSFELRFKKVDKGEYKTISLEELEKVYDENISLLYGIAYTIVKDTTTADEILKQVFLAIRKNYSAGDESKQSRCIRLVNITRKIAQEIVSSQSSGQHHYSSVNLNAQKDNSSGTSTNQSRMTDEQKKVFELIFLGGSNVSEVAKQIELDEIRIKQLLREAVSHYRPEIQETQWK